MAQKLVYYVLQLQLFLAVASSAASEWAGADVATRSFEALGLNSSLLPLLALTKAAALLMLALPSRYWRLREWGFAVLTFVFAGSLYLNLTSGMGLLENWILTPLYLLLTLATYWAYTRLPVRRPRRLAYAVAS